jgi:L-asparaginase
MSQPIVLFVTGGTFDKEYNELTGQLFFNTTHLPKMLERSRCKIPVTVNTLMMKDSLEMTLADRELLLTEIKSTASTGVVITHGTDTMVETAKYLAQQQLPKVIILTGAMIPYAFGSSSDGFFNLGMALAFVQTKPEGVYIAMNGTCFHWNNVRKNKENGYFESLK